MNTNNVKFQFMAFGVNDIAPFRVNIYGKIIPCSNNNKVKLLGITVNNELKFKRHVEDFFKKAS